MQSSMVKSYISAIRSTLAEDGIFIDTDSFLLMSLTWACRLQNDRVVHRFPIYKSLLNLIIDNIQEYYDNLQKAYLATLYKAMLMAGYYGLLRAGEIASGPHVLKAKDVYIGKNKTKFLFILWSSKTHNRGDKPQRIKISSQKVQNQMQTTEGEKHCPFSVLDALNKHEQFFVFSDNSPVTPAMLRTVLKDALIRMNYNPNLYNLHSLRIGRCGDLYKLGLSVETIKKIGR